MVHDDANEQEPSADLPAEAEATSPDAEELIDLVIAAHEARDSRTVDTPARMDGVLIGQLVGLEAEGLALVDWPGCPISGGQKARVMAAISPNDVGRRAALLFEGGDPAKPVVMGLLFEGQHVENPGRAIASESAQANVDGERVVLSAEKEIVLQCGPASITLTQAGKIIIRGAYVSSRSTGVNRIQGGSVQIN